MKEAWEIIYERGVQTVVVWAMNPAFALNGATLAQHEARVASLQTLSAARAEEALDLTTARGVRARVFRQLYALNIRAAQVIDGLLPAESDLHGQLGLVYAAGAGDSQATVLKRARLVAGLWVDFNAQRAAEVPAKPPFTLRYSATGREEDEVDVAVADFDAQILAAQAAQTSESDAQRDLRDAQTALHTAARVVDRDNKRWYKAWTKLHVAGTAKGDAARSQITTAKGTRRPQPLQIASATVTADRAVRVTYAERGGAHATRKALLWRVDAESDFGHATPLVQPAQTVGPFHPGATVAFITRMANSKSRGALSDPVTVVIPA